MSSTPRPSVSNASNASNAFAAPVDPDAAVPRADCASADHRLPIFRYYAEAYDAEVGAMADAIAYFSRHIGVWPHAKIGVINGPQPYNMEYAGLIALRSFSAHLPHARD